MKTTRTRTATKSLAGKTAVAEVHRARKLLCLDNLRLMKMPSDFLDRIPLALN